MHRSYGNSFILLFKCDMCIKSYRGNNELQRHRQFLHMGIKQHGCKVCHKTYVDATRLKVHLQTAHAEKGCFKCSECNKEFTFNHSLKQHFWRYHMLMYSNHGFLSSPLPQHPSPGCLGQQNSPVGLTSSSRSSFAKIGG